MFDRIWPKTFTPKVIFLNLSTISALGQFFLAYLNRILCLVSKTPPPPRCQCLVNAWVGYKGPFSKKVLPLRPHIYRIELVLLTMEIHTRLLQITDVFCREGSSPLHTEFMCLSCSLQHTQTTLPLMASAPFEDCPWHQWMKKDLS